MNFVKWHSHFGFDYTRLLTDAVTGLFSLTAEQLAMFTGRSTNVLAGQVGR